MIFNGLIGPEEKLVSEKTEENCKLWQNCEQTLDTFPEYLKGSRFFPLPYGKHMPKGTQISILTEKPSNIYIVHKDDNEGRCWLSLSSCGYEVAIEALELTRKPEEVKTKQNSILSTIWHIKSKAGDFVQLPPTETKKPVVIIFILDD